MKNKKQFQPERKVRIEVADGHWRATDIRASMFLGLGPQHHNRPPWPSLRFSFTSQPISSLSFIYTLHIWMASFAFQGSIASHDGIEY